MIYELLSTALLACSLGSSNFKNEPKRAVSMPYLGTYGVEISYPTRAGAVLYKISTPTGDSEETQANTWGSPVSVTLGFCTASLTFDHSDGWGQMWCDVFLTINVGDVARERLHESYQYMQEKHNYDMGTNWEVNEFNFEYRPEISLLCSWTIDGTFKSSADLNLLPIYKISYETFGTQENSGVSWITQNDQFSKTFNAINVDNTEPKLYAFWIDRYMLARQVQMDGDIINQNYITTLDRLDPSFGKQVSIHFTPTDDVQLKISAVPYDPTWSLTNDYNRGYNNGYTAGLAEGQTPVSWIKSTFDGIAGFFNIQVFPFVTLGFLCFAPLIVVAIVAILRIIKHD